jgi:hypothetical protein
LAFAISVIVIDGAISEVQLLSMVREQLLVYQGWAQRVHELRRVVGGGGHRERIKDRLLLSGSRRERLVDWRIAHLQVLRVEPMEVEPPALHIPILARVLLIQLLLLTVHIQYRCIWHHVHSVRVRMHLLLWRRSLDQLVHPSAHHAIPGFLILLLLWRHRFRVQNAGTKRQPVSHEGEWARRGHFPLPPVERLQAAEH